MNQNKIIFEIELVSISDKEIKEFNKKARDMNISQEDLLDIINKVFRRNKPISVQFSSEAIREVQYGIERQPINVQVGIKSKLTVVS